jgi:hypothetical protein
MTPAWVAMFVRGSAADCSDRAMATVARGHRAGCPTSRENTNKECGHG